MNSRLLLVLAGLLGAAGVAAAAAASHVPGGTMLASGAELLLVHAAALLGLAALAERRRERGRLVLVLIGIVMAIGAGLFAGDMAARVFHGQGLFPYAAPTGGSSLIGAWIVLALASAVGSIRAE